MSRIMELRQRKADLTTEMRALLDAADAESRDLSDDEVARFDEIEKDLETTASALARQEAAVEHEREIARRSFDEDVPELVDGGEQQPFASLGEQLQAVANHDLGHGLDPRLIRAAATGSGEVVPSDGGFLVQQDFTNDLVRRVWELGAIANRTRRVPISAGSNGLKLNTIAETSRATGSRWGGVQVYWVGEGDAATASRPKFRRIELTLQKLMGLHYVTDELLADQTALDAVSRQAFAEEFVFVLEDAIINGSGGGQPMGILNSGAVVSVAKETGQLAATIQVENIVKMWARMLPRSRQNSVWLINQAIEPQLFTMGITFGTGGQAVYMPAGGISASPFGTLMGRPVIPVEYTADLGTVGDILLVDLQQYLVIEKSAMQSAASMHVRFLNDEMTFRYTWRINGQPIDAAPITPFKGADTLAPFVSLATRA